MSPPNTAPPLVALRGVAVGFGGPPIFADLSLGLTRGQRVCLIGRNGSGKSTLMKLLTGAVEPDAGERFVQPGVRIAHLAQDPPFVPGATVAAFVAEPEGAALPATHEVDAVLERLGLDGSRSMETLSGGEARRAALARALVTAPDVLLLDEPTNHLDLPTIEWLERELAGFQGAALIVSHDRTFLDNVTRRILWLDRGRIRATDRPFREFDDWVEQVMADEEKEAERLDTKLAAELHWLHRGVTARRKRNQGRLRRLQSMRAERATLLGGRQTVAFAASAGDARSKVMIEAEGIAKSFAGPDGVRQVVAPFSTRILRGDRVGLLGPNGAGKTTLLRLLTGDLEPDQGRVRIARTIETAYFDQHRASLDAEDSLWRTLCPDGGDTVWVQGRPQHVVGYLKQFLFTADQVRSPVKTLSGGERNRLLLARILAKPSDLLVLDEPTNDLDMETLDLLEEAIGDYDGTLLVVSHDRDFLDRTVTAVIAMEGDGIAREYVGGYSDYRRQAGQAAARVRTADGGRTVSPRERTKAAPARLSYKEQRELDGLPDRMAALDREIGALTGTLADPDLYRRDPTGFRTATGRLGAAQAEKDAAEERWLELEMKREELADAKQP